MESKSPKQQLKSSAAGLHYSIPFHDEGATTNTSNPRFRANRDKKKAPSVKVASPKMKQKMSGEIIYSPIYKPTTAFISTKMSRSVKSCPAASVNSRAASPVVSSVKSRAPSIDSSVRSRVTMDDGASLVEIARRFLDSPVVQQNLE
jgi:IS30 family transposase